MSSIQRLAQSLQRHGRNGDTRLVHMHPSEIRVLEYLSGNKATINPVTGLEEGFSWKKLLAGIGLGVAALASGGAAIPGLTALSALGSTGAGILGATAASLGTSAFLDPKKQQTATDDSAARKYLTEQGLKNLSKYQIPLIRLDAIQQQPGYVPGVNQEQFIAPIRTPYGSVSGTGQYTGYAEGGMIPEQEEAMAVKQAVMNGQLDEATLRRFIEIFGQDELMQLLGQQEPQQAKSGGLLKGPGGGMDDLIRAKVAGGPPVALSGGEYVVAGDVVSALGDGSNEQGGRVLDAMAATIRKSKTGTTEQPGKINLRKVLPI